MKGLLLLGGVACCVGKGCPPGQYQTLYKSQMTCLDCPRGTYGDQFGQKDRSCSGLCSAGRFGRSPGQTSRECSGPCEAGYFCQAGETTPRGNKCGGYEYFCPVGSSMRQLVSTGYYTAGGDPMTRTSQVICPPGHYCSGGRKYICPAGRYAFVNGSSTSDCQGACPLGYYCPKGSIKPLKCPPGTYGSEKELSTPACSGKCNTGHYCPEDVINTNAEQIQCPAGRFGEKQGLISALCTHICDTTSGKCVDSASVCPPGYYCPLGTKSRHENPCGGSDVFCPLGSETPQQVSEGYYTVGGDSDNTRTSETICEKGFYCISGRKHKCPAGSYGSEEGLSTRSCSGRAAQGYFTERTAVSRFQHRCGNIDSYCPEGSYQPTKISTGYYTIGGGPLTRTDQLECQPGFFCDGSGIRRKCPAGTYGLKGGLSSKACSGKCPKGYYCPEGTIVGTSHACPAGRYGATVGLKNAKCSGPCKEGHFCKEASTTPTQYICSAADPSPTLDEGVPWGKESGVYYGNQHGEYGIRARDKVYCPKGSSAPIPVEDGYYATGGPSEGLRVYQQLCKPENDLSKSSACEYIIKT
mmetsp:Transcript_19575/g.32190  ORF Transcript_19575/g.32190 Transcript_19575/m.32190 type:complete len:581 (-) Transcript_19575:642-2384(-)